MQRKAKNLRFGIREIATDWKFILKSTFETLKFFRGIKDQIPLDRPSIHETRMDRRPRDSALHLHSAADNWFNEKFGTRYRSQALFVTSDWATARLYASSDDRVFRIVPLTDYKFCWSPQLKDFLEYGLRPNQAETISQFLDRSDYTEIDLLAAHGSGHEVMLHCAEYLAVPHPQPVRVAPILSGLIL